MVEQASDLIRPIETEYRGCRFRSRLEARWAVFFDAAGIEWQYEPEGYVVNGRSYLPDFFLPRLDAIVEVKPTPEAGAEVELLLRALAAGSGRRVFLLGGSPDPFDLPPIAGFVQFDDFGGPDVYKRQFTWRQCPFCEHATLWRPCEQTQQECVCAPGIKFLRIPTGCSPRVEYAMGEARRARFEHGEDGTPRPYWPEARKEALVYVAGSVLEPEADYPALAAWREELFGHDDCHPPFLAADRIWYAGPSILLDHGGAVHDLASNCAEEVSKAEALFAWIDTDTLGTLVEIGIAYAQHKPIFIAFADDGGLVQRFYFARQLATVAIQAPSAASAWGLFIRWRGLP
jgi:hypothetical protein